MTVVAVSGPEQVTGRQAEFVAEELLARLLPGDTLVSGAAYGVDSIGAAVARELGLYLVLTVPMDLRHNRPLVATIDAHVINVPGTYMDRNDITADEADQLVAFPPHSEEELRSGTWATVRRFRSRGKPVELVPLAWAGVG